MNAPPTPDGGQGHSCAAGEGTRTSYDARVDPETPARPPAPEGAPGVRERIVEAAYALFSRRGVRAVGVGGLAAAAGVAPSTLYRHFRSKDDLVLAYLKRRFQERSTAVAVSAAPGDQEAILAVFDVFARWFREDSPEVAGFVQVLIEMGPGHPLGRASAAYLAQDRASLERVAAAAGLRDPEGFAWSCHLLLQGAIIAHEEGDPEAAGRARHLAALLIEHHRREPAP